ncbi:uncharacterized protein [Parasteatoda tepidariorum]|uniref:uncharacterized protein n=1 Tax=Parasteatoda tepidariorum TaxID=114398 RepID=UPI0039BCC7D0
MELSDVSWIIISYSTTKAYSTTSTEALQILAGVIPIHLKILEDISTKRLTWGWGLTDLEIVLGHSLDSIALEQRPVRQHPSKFASVPWGRSLPTNEGLEIFTDGSRVEFAEETDNGSRIKHKTGFGIIIKRNGIIIKADSIRLSNNCSIFMAELMAIKSAFDWLAKNDYPDATLFTDSLSSLQALSDPTPNNKETENTKQLWRPNITCNWVRAHIGILGNEEADQAAKEAVSLSQINLEVPSSKAQIKTIIKSNNLNRWKTEWQSSERGRQTYIFFKDPSTKRLQANFYLNQLLTGHGVFGEYQNRLFNKNPNCTYCGDNQTIEHLILNCPHFQTLRGNHFAGQNLHQCFAKLVCRNIVKQIIKVTLEDTLNHI